MPSGFAENPLARSPAFARWLELAETVPPCGPSDLAVSVRWSRSGTALRGEVVAENVGNRSCRLGPKPGLRPLHRNGQPLPVPHVVTLEGRIPPFVVLEPGHRAAAPVGWSGWCGQPASRRMEVSWDGGTAVVTVDGPTQPGCPERGNGNLTSGWFTLLD